AASAPRLPLSLTLQLLKTTVFHNASSTNMEGVALLGDLETHAMDCSTCKIRFLQPWAHRGLTPKLWQDLETVICHYVSKFILLVNKASIGSELHPNGTSRQFCDAAVNGENFISFSVDMGTWVAQRGEKVALNSRDFLNQDKSTTAAVQFLLRTTCINELNRPLSPARLSPPVSERPVAMVFARAPPPAGTPAPFLLVCRVTGFYPRPVRVAWLQDGEEVAPGWRLNSSGILPNTDLTYQLRSNLAVGPDAGHSYACRVEHSSLGGQSLLIPWGYSRPWGPGLAVGITLGALAVAAVAENTQVSPLPP
uniref:Ig-like domain-containing protein n=1 Tax=Chelydra serpentina TaxID=8475 RepID=A0A8C3SFV4_CHESE